MSNININNEANLRVQNLRVKKIKGLPEGSPDFLIGVDADGYTSQIAVGDVGGGGGGAGLVDGDYGDVVVSGVGTVMTIDDLAVTTAKIADNAVELGKIQAIGQHKLIGRHSTGDGIPHQIGVTNGIEFAGQDIGIADSGVTQAKLDATGAAAGKVLTTDGTAMTWETPAGGGLTLPIDETVGVYSNEAAIALTLSQPSAGYTRYPKGVSLSIENFTGDGTGQGIGLEITGADGSSSGGPCYSLAIKSGDPISTTHILNTEQNYLTIDSSHVRIGGVYEWNEGYAGQSSFAITGSLNIDINNPSIPIGDGSVTETKLGDSSVTQAKISATGADVGKVLTTDGTTMTWETPYTAPTGTAENTTRFNASGQLVETNAITISDAADVIVTGNTVDVSLNTGGSYIYMDSTSGYIQLENVDSYGGIYWRKNTTGATLSMDVDAEDSITSVDYRIKLDANTYTGNGSILVGEYDVAEDVPKWAFRNIADYTTPNNVPYYFNTSTVTRVTNKVTKSLMDDFAVRTKTKLKATVTNSRVSYKIYKHKNNVISAATTMLRKGCFYLNGKYYFGCDQSSGDGVGLHYCTSLFNDFQGEYADYLGAYRIGEGLDFYQNIITGEVLFTPRLEGVSRGVFAFYNDGTGINGWQLIKPPVTSDDYHIWFGGFGSNWCVSNGVISKVFLGLSDRRWTEDNGETWNTCTGSPGQTIKTMSNGTLYNTENGSTALHYSIDNGKTWVSQTLPISPNQNDHNIDYNGSIYVYVAAGTNAVYTSPSLATDSWTLRTSAFTSSFPRTVWWCNDIFIACSTASQTNNIMTSSDGITWTQRASDVAFEASVAKKIGSYYVVTGIIRTVRTNNIASTFSTLMTTGNYYQIGLENAIVSFVPNECVIADVNGTAVYKYNGLTNVLTTVSSSQQLNDVYLTSSSVSLYI